MQYDSDYEVRLATLGAMGGNTGATYDSVYDIDLEILRLTEQGGGGGGTGTSIDDNVIATNKTWSSSKINNQLSGKQATLTAGTNISIENNVISAQQPDLSGYATSEDLNNGLSFKQDTLTAGTGINLVNSVISAEPVIDDINASTGTTYSSNKIIELTQGLGFDVEVVQALPQTGDAQTIYMVPKADSAATDVYDEYIYTNNAWEKIGNTQTDLSNYYNKTETDTLLAGKQTTLTAGTGIQIVDNVISATGGGGGTALSAGTNISIVDNKINALGYARKASGSEAGAGLQANNTREFAVGTYNTIGILSNAYQRPVFTVGVGNPLTQVRENGLVVSETGNVYIKGIGGYTGTNPLTNNTLQVTVNSKVGSTSVATIWTGSQADYDLIDTKDPNTLYIIN